MKRQFFIFTLPFCIVFGYRFESAPFSVFQPIRFESGPFSVCWPIRFESGPFSVCRPLRFATGMDASSVRANTNIYVVSASSCELISPKRRYKRLGTPHGSMHTIGVLTQMPTHRWSVIAC